MNVDAGVASAGQRAVLLSLYESGVREVYGYLLHRCGAVATAEDLTNDTFVSAARAVIDGRVAAPSTGWLVTIARNKLIDHWRREAREERSLRAVAPDDEPADDPWSAELDEGRALDVLRRLSAPHRSVLTLRYLDGLSVPEVADAISRTVHATEALLVRARAAFRRTYEGDGR